MEKTMLEVFSQKWASIMDALFKTHLPTSALMRCCKIIDAGENFLLISFPSNLLTSKFDDPRVRAIFEKVVSDVMGVQVSVRAKYRCQVCDQPGNNRTLHAHHRTYERLGHELDSDITVLCDDCHKLFSTNGKLAKTGASKLPTEL